MPPKVGEERPAAVRAEVSLELSRVSPEVRQEWESLRPDDVVFLLGVKGVDDSDKMITNGTNDRLSLVENYGIKCLRAAEVVSVLDAQGRQLGSGDNRVKSSGGQCRLHLKLDADMFQVCWQISPAVGPSTDIHRSIVKTLRLESPISMTRLMSSSAVKEG
jgi:intron-binding protein aquarius